MAKNNLRLIPMRSNDMGHVFTITEALNNGEIVAMAVDRIVQSKGVPCTFMQDNALFPIGPFRICSTMQKTVLSVFVLKESGVPLICCGEKMGELDANSSTFFLDTQNVLDLHTPNCIQTLKSDIHSRVACNIMR